MSADRRMACRLDCELPVEVDTLRGAVGATTCDVSRTGMRLRITTEALGFVASDDLGQTATEVGQVLRATFAARLHYRRLGPLLERHTTMTRLGIPADAPDAIEICCSFDRELSADDCVALGVPLPPVAGSDEAFVPRADSAAPHRREASLEPLRPLGARARSTPGEARPEEPASPTAFDATGDGEPEVVRESTDGKDLPAINSAAKHQYRAYLAGGGQALNCTSDHLSRTAVRVRIPREGYEDLGVTDATKKFVSAFGDRINLKLMDVAEHLWTGPTRVVAVELPEDRPAEMYVTLAFARRLRPAELKRMGMQSDVA